MNRTLVICLLVAVLAGLVATCSALLAGWGWLAAFALYSATGSASLIAALAALSEPQAAWAARRAPVEQARLRLRQST